MNAGRWTSSASRGVVATSAPWTSRTSASGTVSGPAGAIAVRPAGDFAALGNACDHAARRRDRHDPAADEPVGRNENIACARTLQEAAQRETVAFLTTEALREVARREHLSVLGIRWVDHGGCERIEIGARLELDHDPQIAVALCRADLVQPDKQAGRDGDFRARRLGRAAEREGEGGEREKMERARTQTGHEPVLRVE